MKRSAFIGVTILIIGICGYFGLKLINNNDIIIKNRIQHGLASNNGKAIASINAVSFNCKQLERRYSSPDGKNLIKQITNGTFDDTGEIIIEYYLNGNNAAFEEAYVGNIKTFTSNKLKPEWIDNNRVVIDGKYIYFIDIGNKQKIFNEDYWIVSYSINSDKSKIAYYICHNYELKVLVYDIASGKSNIIYTQEINENTNEDIVNYIGTVLWDINNNIYFNSLSSDWENAVVSNILKYDYKEKRTEEFAKNELLLSSSADKSFFAILNGNEVAIINCITRMSNKVGCVNEFYWSSQNKTFIYTVVGQDRTIFIGNINNDDIKTEKQSVIANLDNEYIIFNLRDENGKFIYDYINYNDSEGIINDIITYSLNIKE